MPQEKIKRNVMALLPFQPVDLTGKVVIITGATSGECRIPEDNVCSARV